MSREATDLVLGLADDTQREYAAAHKTPTAPSPAVGPDSEAVARKGSQPAASVKTSVTPAPSPRSGVADTDSSDADAVGALASEGQTPAAGSEAGPATTAPRPQVSPRWFAVDDETADLLSLIASEHPAIPQEEREWDHFVSVLRRAASASHGLINQNAVRPLMRGEIKPQRIGAFYNRAARTGLIRPSAEHATSNDRHGRNSGKPMRVWEWLGT